MFIKLKEFVKTNKVLVLIVVLIFILCLLLVIFFVSKEQKLDEEDSRHTDMETEADVLEYYSNYQIDFADGIVKELESYDGDYTSYEIQVLDHIDGVRNFVDALKRGDLIYTEISRPAIAGDKLHTLDQSQHVWTAGNDFVSYDVATDLLSFNFEIGQAITGIQINPRDMNNVKAGLEKISKELFLADFDYNIKNISRDGNDFKVEYTRVLDNLPIIVRPGLSIILTPDGRLKSGMFLLAEFVRYKGVQIPSGDYLVGNINDTNYPKEISFRLTTYPEAYVDNVGYIITLEENANVYFDQVNLVYSYRSKFQEKIYPQFFFEGDGIVEIEGENFEARFVMYTD